MLSKIQRSKSSHAGQITLTAAFAKTAAQGQHAQQASVVEDILTLSCDDGSVEEVNIVLTAAPSSPFRHRLDAESPVHRKRGREDNEVVDGQAIFERFRSSFPLTATVPSESEFTMAARWCLSRDDVAGVKSMLRRAACCPSSEGKFELLVETADVEVTKWINERIPQDKRQVHWHLEFA